MPQACRRNGILLIDTGSLKDTDDIKSDLNGVFNVCNEAKCVTVHVSRNSLDQPKKVVIKAQKKLELEANQMHLQINRHENNFGLVRSILYFKDANNAVVNNCAILQCSVNGKSVGDANPVMYNVAPHGNAKGNSQLQPLKRSTIAAIKEAISPTKRSCSQRIYESLTESDACHNRD